MKKRLFAILALALLGVSAWPMWLALRAQGGLGKARSLAQMNLWPGVRKQLDRYLWLHPSSPDARLLMAEALVKDEQLPSGEAVPAALAHLARIADDSPQGAQARLQEGRLRLSMLLQPAKAERALRRATELAPDSFEANFLLWKTFDLTGRSQLGEDLFWKVFDLAPEAERAPLLRKWYLSQFYPAAATPDLERQLGLLGASESPTELTEHRRLLVFQEAEPDEPLGYAALARWFCLEGDPRKALKVLDEADSVLHNEPDEPFYLATLIEVLINLGEYERAEAAFERWPEPHTGHEYFKWKAVVLDEIRGEHQEALAWYARALSMWPGPVDWMLVHRKAGCHSRLRQRQQAEAERAHAKTIEDLVTETSHQRVRADLDGLDDPEAIERVASFYERLKCQRETQAWKQEAQRLRQLAPPAARANVP